MELLKPGIWRVVITGIGGIWSPDDAFQNDWDLFHHGIGEKPVTPLFKIEPSDPINSATLLFYLFGGYCKVNWCKVETDFDMPFNAIQCRACTELFASKKSDFSIRSLPSLETWIFRWQSVSVRTSIFPPREQQTTQRLIVPSLSHHFPKMFPTVFQN